MVRMATKATTRLRWHLLLHILLSPISVEPFSADVSFSLFDRWRASCPASIDSIRQFEPSLIPTDNGSSDVWVAVYRSSNNKPSVLVKDDFLHAMRSATDTINSTTPPSADPAMIVGGSKAAAAAPVAVARLKRESNHSFLLDSIRCILKKEDTDPACDGGSEHTEALATAIDALLQHYLVSVMDKEDSRFEGVIRTKATLVSAILVEDRGFRPVETLRKDMATHTSSLDDCLECYAVRSVSTDSKSPGARQRAVAIVSQLGRIDRDFDLQQAALLAAGDDKSDEGGEEDDPWSGMKRFI